MLLGPMATGSALSPLVIIYRALAQRGYETLPVVAWQGTPFVNSEGQVPGQRFSGRERDRRKAPRITSQVSQPSVVDGCLHDSALSAFGEGKKNSHTFSLVMCLYETLRFRRVISHMDREGASFLPIANRNDKKQ